MKFASPPVRKAHLPYSLIRELGLTNSSGDVHRTSKVALSSNNLTVHPLDKLILQIDEIHYGPTGDRKVASDVIGGAGTYGAFALHGASYLRV